MSDNKANLQSTAFGTIGFLAKNPLAADPSKDEDTQKQINDLQSESITPNDQNHYRRKSIIDNEENNSMPAMIDSSLNRHPQGIIRSSMSESVLIDASESLPTLPIQQDESSTDDDDDDQHAIIQSEFAERSQPENRSRIQSTSNKRSPSGETHPQLSDDTDHEIANILRRSPAQEDSRKTPTNVESKRAQSSSSSSKNHKEEKFGPPTAIISPASRRESTNKIDQQQSSRVSSTKKSNLNDSSTESLTDESHNVFFTMNEQSKLIKPGEQLQIPANDIHTKGLNSPPPSPSTNKQIDFTNPSSKKTEQKQSRPGSQSPINNTEDNIIPTISNQKPNSMVSSRKGSTASENNTNNSRRTSAKQERISSKDQRKSPLEKRSAQQSRKNSSKIADQTAVTPIKIPSSKSQQHSSTIDSDHEKLPHIHSSSQSTTPTNDHQTNVWTKKTPIPPLSTTENETPISRPQSPNVEQIAERNQHSSSNKKRIFNDQKKKGQHHSLRRSNSTESFNHIPLVDDQSLDSTSGNNTESDQPKQRSVKSQKKDVETNTDSRNGNHQQRKQETISSKANKSMPDHPSSIHRRIPSKHQKTTTPDTETDSNIPTIRRSVKKSKTPNEDKDPIDVLDNQIQQRYTQSDTEQILTEKRKKRRRPKRISRTTQTYECVFRRMEHDEHEELRPTTDTDKNIQTRRSCLRPRTRSPKRHYPLYLSTDAFKIEEILPKQFPSSQRNTSKTSIIARSNSPQGGKLLILRPTLPFHHTDAVNVQRISLQYAIELIPNENKFHDTTHHQRHKSNVLKQSEHTNNLPLLRSSSSSVVNQPPAKSNTKDRSPSNKIEDRTYQRKTGGAI